MKKTAIVKKKEETTLAQAMSRTAIENVESTGTAMMQTAQEYTLVIEQVLMDDFGFTEKDLKRMHSKVEYTIKVVREAEGLGMNSVGIRTLRALGEIAEIRKKRELQGKSGLILPDTKKEEIISKLLEN